MSEAAPPRRAALSMAVFGVYLLGEGALLLLAPDVLLGLLRLPPPADGWVRVVGLSLLVLAFYYLASARLNLTPFFRLTVPTRLAQFLVLGGLVLAGQLHPAVLPPALVEAASGVWTAWALARDARR